MAGDRVYSSSSGESISGASTDSSMCEELFEEEGERSLILVARREASTSKATAVDKWERVDDLVLEGLGCPEFFLACVASLKREELVRRSPRGQRAKVFLDFIETMELERVAEIATFFICMMNNCLVAGYRHKLPSAAQASVWSTFHELRGSQHVKHTWNAFISAQVPQCHQKEPQLALQLLMDRVLKRLIENKAKVARQHIKSSTAGSVKPPTALEINAIRCMAGYVAVSLLKKYRKFSKHPQLQLKHSMFVRVLNGMKATDQPGEPNSLLEYSKVWSELIDRGGLYHISDKVFHLIETAVRQHLSVEQLHSYIPGTDL